MRHSITLGMTVLALALAVAPAVAQSPADVEKAKKYYASGSKHFDLAEYDQALADFKEGYRLKDDPVFLYNIAQCYRLLNKPSEAIQFYKSYLRRQPEAPNRAQVEEKITQLQETVAAQEKSRTQPPQDTLKPEGGDKIPDPADVEDGNEDGADTTATATGPVDTGGSGKKPIYKKWWFWAGVGAVAVGTVAIIVVATSGDETSGTTFPMVTF